MPHIVFARSCAVALCMAWSLAAGAAEPVKVSDRARQHFEAGVHFMQDPDGARYEEAHREFKAAYADSPSWKILGNLGIAAMKLERDGEAIEAFETYLAEGGTELDRAERAQFKRDLETLRTSVVWVTLRSLPPGASLTDERIPVSGSAVVNRYPELGEEMKLGLRSGHHRLTATLPGHEAAVWELDAQPGKTYDHSFELKPIPTAPEPEPSSPVVEAAPAPAMPPVEQPSPMPMGVYIGLGVTGALAVGAGVTAILASGKQSEYQDINDGSDPARAEELKESGETLNVVTDVLLGGALVAGGVTAILYFTRDRSEPSEVASLEWTPVVSTHGGALSLSGRF